MCIIHQVILDNATWVSLGLTVMLQQRYQMLKLPHKEHPIHSSGTQTHHAGILILCSKGQKFKPDVFHFPSLMSQSNKAGDH